ncbi:Ras guanine nucleotide exchange factor A [Tolypocladium capitatum]|uniref:Ras guanine nucleotide exchange factor A n=1 Tax=Tolypocladium capitatum TaxID=45235 RepID=A0A2K3Q964_9HYPO|nr:Ras guanine nucleotide exchange factor A [Tolypocladium capitatum]
MPSSNAGARKAHRTSDGSGSLPRRSTAAPTPTSVRRPSAAAARDSAQSNTTACAFSRAGSSAALAPPSDAACGDRNSIVSIVSIVDDPFFQRFDPGLDVDPDDAEASDESSSVEHDDGDENSKTERWPPPRRESLTIGPSQYWSHPISAMESYNIAVIGTSAVGKSSFIQRVLALPRPPMSNASSVRMVVDNITHMITLLELDLDCFELSSPQSIQWPKQVNGHIVPRVDAALVLYDVMNEESIRELPQAVCMHAPPASRFLHGEASVLTLIVAALTNSGLSAVLVACKCDNDEDEWEVDADAIANHRFFKPCMANYKVSMHKPDVCRACLQTILRAAVAHRRGMQRPTFCLRPKTLHADETTDESGEMLSRRRAQSAANLEAPDPTSGRPLSEHSKHSRASSDFSVLRGFPNTQTTDTYRTRSSRSPRPGFRVDRPGGDSFLELEESDGESRRYSDDIPLLQRGDDNVIEKQPKMAGVTFDELVDRLLALRLSRADINFSDIFLCLYRKFAAPSALFSAILVRLDRVRDDKTAHYLTKTATQLRIIEVVAKWVSLYPGDFARPSTRRSLKDLIQHLSTEPIFSIASQQMRRNLKFDVVVDDDTGWANADDAGDEMASEILSKEMNELSSGINTLQFDDEANGRPSNSSSYEEYEREAGLLEPTEHLPMNKFRYHIFKDISDDDVADELTRLDWILFSSIRVRDFVRHVSLSAIQKEKCRSLRNVNRMINHFNHIAKWVANMILLRDKAKHRAQMLEKFMSIALKLRQLNNYNGLAAVLAGINGTAIHRLAHTWALVPVDVQKRFARLVILMGTQKSHFAYRLAWENSPLPRIPFIPLHRRDLVSAEEGSQTFVGPGGDRINWKKFEVLGEVLLPIMKSQGASYLNLAKHNSARDLILGCRMPTDDEASPRTSRLSIYYLTNICGAGNLSTKSGSGKQCLGRDGSEQDEVSLVCQMPHTNVSLPRLHIASRREDVELVLQGSLLLTFPDNLSSPATSSELLELVTKGYLWTRRTGSCHFNISISAGGEPITGGDHEMRLAEWIQACEIWEPLGLQLQYCGSSLAQPSVGMIFSIQHPDLSSALVAPAAACTAEFRSSSCSIDICTKKASRAASNQRDRKRRKKEDHEAQLEEHSDVPSQDDDYFYHSLTVADRMAIDKFVLSMNFGAGEKRDEQGPKRKERDLSQLVDKIMGSDHVQDLIHAALKILVLGHKGQNRGVTVLESTPSQSLTDLAPAVFHIPYLRASITRRIDFEPSLISLPGHLRSCKSSANYSHVPGSNEKCRDLGDGTRGEQRFLSSNGGGPDHLRNREECVEPPPLLGKSAARKQAVISSPGDKGSRHSVEPDSCSGDTNGTPTMVSHFEMKDDMMAPKSHVSQSPLASGFPNASIDYEYLPPSQTGSSSGFESQSSLSSETRSSPRPHEYYNYQLPPTNLPWIQFYGGSPPQVEPESSFTNAHSGHDKGIPAGETSVSDPAVFSTFEQWLYPS